MSCTARVAFVLYTKRNNKKLKMEELIIVFVKSQFALSQYKCFCIVTVQNYFSHSVCLSLPIIFWTIFLRRWSCSIAVLCRSLGLFNISLWKLPLFIVLSRDTYLQDIYVGGVFLLIHGGAIVVENTFESRVEITYQHTLQISAKSCLEIFITGIWIWKRNKVLHQWFAYFSTMFQKPAQFVVFISTPQPPSKV